MVTSIYFKLKIDNTFWKLVGLGIVLWIIQVSPFLLGFYLNNDVENSSVFVYRGEIGFSEDLMVYAAQIKHAAIEPHFFRTDALIHESSGNFFPDGNLIVLYCAFFYWLLGNWDAVLVFSSLPCVILSCFVLHKIVSFFTDSKTNFRLFILIGTFVFLTELMDFTGIFKLLESFQNKGVFVPGLHKLIMGNPQRFPQSQLTIFLFLAWVLALINTLKFARTKDYIFLALSLVVLQYTYFFFWTFALGFSLLIVLPEWFKNYKPWLLFAIYAVGTLPFWLVFLNFNQGDFANEYQLKMRGYETYPSFVFHLIGSASLLLAFAKRLNFTSITTIVFVALLQVVIQQTIYVFSPEAMLYQAVQFGSPLLLLIFLFINLKKGDLETHEKLLLVNYWATFILINLKFIIGFNVQPFHWVNFAFYPVLLIGFVPIVHGFLQKFAFTKSVIALSSFVVLIALANGVVFAKSTHRFWQFTPKESEVLTFLKQKPPSVIGGNNVAFSITCAIHTPHKLLTGISHTNYLKNKEAYHRLIKNFKKMGYSDAQILLEVNQYKSKRTYKKAFVFNNDSLAKTWPDNTTLFAEAVCHYFENPENYLPEFKSALRNYSEKEFPSQLDYLLIYKPTFRGNLDTLESKVVMENDSYLVLEVI